MTMRSICAFILLLSFSCAVMAGPRISVVALFNGKAMLDVDGQRRLLTVGEVSPEGVRLIAADPHGAVLEIEGVRHTVGLSRTIGGSYAAPERREVRISSVNGMYRTTGAINGVPVELLLDTGASVVALSGVLAAQLGIDYRLKGTRIKVHTASGDATAYRVVLDRLAVGEINLTKVEAAVLEGSNPAVPLLGMSFLGRLKMRNEGQLMVLEQAP
jgi:aspartyl protease family protein